MAIASRKWLYGSIGAWAASWIAVPMLIVAMVMASRSPERAHTNVQQSVTSTSTVSSNATTQSTVQAVSTSTSASTATNQSSSSITNRTSTSTPAPAATSSSARSTRTTAAFHNNGVQRPPTPAPVQRQQTSALGEYFRTHSDGQQYGGQIQSVLTVFDGYVDGNIGLTNPLSRAQAASLVARTFSLRRTNPQKSLNTNFVGDVDPRMSHAYNIDALYENGVTNGCATDPLRFCPTQNVTRRHFAIFFSKAAQRAGYALPQDRNPYVLSDVSADSAGYSEISRLQRAGLLNACGGNAREGFRFCPDAPLTRGEAARILARYFSLSH